MSDESVSKAEGLLSARQYYPARLKFLWRMLKPKARHAKQQLANMAQLRENWGTMLEDNARQYPDNPAVKAPEGVLTYKEYNEAANRYARYLIGKGLKRGDVVIVFLESRLEMVVVYSALAKIGAVNAMINTNLREQSLVHVMTLNPGAAFIIGEEVFESFEAVMPELNLTSEQQLYYVPDSGERSCPEGFTDLPEAVKDQSTDNPPTTSQVEPKDALAYVFTSGTTGGMPKAAVVRHARTVRARYFTGCMVLDIKPDDTFYVPLPFFHTNALALSWPTVFAGGAALAIRRKFSVSNFWSDVKKYNATIFCYVGEICRYLVNQPPTLEEKNNPLKTIVGNGLKPDIWMEFKNRFEIKNMFEIYGAAEANIFFINYLNLDYTVGTTFGPYAIVEYDVEEETPIRGPDGFLKRVKPGETGLLIGEITEASPLPGYTDKEKTEEKILRNVFRKADAWFNSGDLLRDIGYNHSQFVDRLGDTFRWKGENVSTTEVEEAANLYPGATLCTSYGVLMPGGDGRAGMIALVTEPGKNVFKVEGLASHFQKVLPSYAMPRFLRLVNDFEYTATHKIKKIQLKKEGFDPDMVADPLYVLLPGESEYRPLSRDIYAEIVAGKYQF